MHNTLKVGPWRVDRDLNQLELDGQVYKLRPRTMDLLIYLAERAGQVVSIEDLLTGVWRGVVVSDSSVYQAIRELRSTFEAAGTKSLIETIPKRGYLLKAMTDTGEAAGQPARSSGSLRRRVAIGAALVVLLAAVAFATRYAGEETSSVAVLAFTDLSPRGDKEYLTDGVSEAVFHYLARIDGLRVARVTTTRELAWPQLKSHRQSAILTTPSS